MNSIKFGNFIEFEFLLKYVESLALSTSIAETSAISLNENAKLLKEIRDELLNKGKGASNALDNVVITDYGILFFVVQEVCWTFFKPVGDSSIQYYQGTYFNEHALGQFVFNALDAFCCKNSCIPIYFASTKKAHCCVGELIHDIMNSNDFNSKNLYYVLLDGAIEINASTAGDFAKNFFSGSMAQVPQSQISADSPGNRSSLDKFFDKFQK